MTESWTEAQIRAAARELWRVSDNVGIYWIDGLLDALRSAGYGAVMNTNSAPAADHIAIFDGVPTEPPAAGYCAVMDTTHEHFGSGGSQWCDRCGESPDDPVHQATPEETTP